MIHDAPQLRGLGDGYSTAGQVTSAGGAISASVIASAGTSGALAASTVAVAVPVIGAAVLAVTLVLMAISKRNAQKTLATSIVNDIEPQLKINLSAYMAGPRTALSQQQALANFDAGWLMVLENCGRKDLGSAGERCISERMQGGTAPWCPSPDHRGCDWFALYRDPIASDVPVSASNPLQTAAAELFPGLTAEQREQAPIWLAVAAIAAGVLLL